MSDKIYISVPVNVARNTLVEMKKLCPNAEVFNSSKKYYHDDLVYLEKIREGKMDEVPDILVSIRPELQWARDEILKKDVFDTDFRYEVRDDLGSEGLFDENWLLKPIYVMPLVIFHSSTMENHPTSWADLLDPRFKGKIVTTDEATPPAEFLKHFCKHIFKDEGEKFVNESVAYLGLPIDVNKAVTNKEYEIGIMPLSFAIFSKDNSTQVCWPKEGALQLTQVMLVKKGVSEECIKAATHLVSRTMQETFSKGASFVPINLNVELPKHFVENEKSLLWNGFDDFMKMG